jgi:hypothetical protein|tara:strand:+ start:344 stop:499 length:156 start_codon:yes stop_codon:yes gene_type:complete
MDFNSLKVYAVNLAAVTASTFDMVEDSLKIFLLLISIGYTIQKWWEIKKKK